MKPHRSTDARSTYQRFATSDGGTPGGTGEIFHARVADRRTRKTGNTPRSTFWSRRICMPRTQRKTGQAEDYPGIVMRFGNGRLTDADFEIDPRAWSGRPCRLAPGGAPPRPACGHLAGRRSAGRTSTVRSGRTGYCCTFPSAGKPRRCLSRTTPASPTPCCICAISSCWKQAPKRCWWSMTRAPPIFPTGTTA